MSQAICPKCHKPILNGSAGSAPMRGQQSQTGPQAAPTNAKGIPTIGQHPGVNAPSCMDVRVIKRVQTALKNMGYDLGPFGPDHDGVDGIWGCYTQGAFDRSGMSFEQLAGEHCQLPTPHANGCQNPQTPPH